MHTKHAGAKLKGKEMYSYQNEPQPLRFNFTDMLQTARFHPAVHSPIGPEPGHAGFHHAHTDGFKVFDHHGVAFLRAHFRKA